MALTHKQDIPNRPAEQREWTVRKLFSFGSAVSAVSKTFTNPFDVLLGFLVFIAGVTELLGRHVSWFFWVFSILIFLASLLEHHKATLEEPKKEVKK